MSTSSLVKLDVLEPRILLAGDLPVLNPLGASSGGVAVVQVVSASTQQAGSAPFGSSALLPALAGAAPSVVSPSGSERLAADVPLTDGKLMLGSGSTLVGSGVLGADLVNQGVVSPGASPGVLSLQNFEQGTSGKLEVQLGGLTAGPSSGNALDGYDQVDVSGKATLAGTLALEFINDFRPVAGQVFDVMKWSERSGSFRSYTGLYSGKGIYLKPVYQANGLQLVASVLPGLGEISIASVVSLK